MVEVEIRAAHNVLEACAQTETIDKVVFTSSATAVVWRDDLKSMESDLEERHWSNVNLCRKFKVILILHVSCNNNVNSSGSSNFCSNSDDIYQVGISFFFFPNFFVLFCYGT